METIPQWLKKRVSADASCSKVSGLLKESELNTVCQSAVCPNINECFNRGTATFMILGDICTRSCKFCAVKKGSPKPLDANEPQKVADAVKKLGLSYAVVTSVTRDDLEDGGAKHFAETVKAIRKTNPRIKIEILIPDFKGSKEAIKTVVAAKPDVINHNVETVPALYTEIRPQAEYVRSLQLLSEIKEQNKSMLAKSGLMLGLGETNEEIINVMSDLRKCGCDILTLGQYLRPNKECVSVKKYVTPEEFEDYSKSAYEMGFVSVASGPFVRSSYHAEQYGKCKIGSGGL